MPAIAFSVGLAGFHYFLIHRGVTTNEQLKNQFPRNDHGHLRSWKFLADLLCTTSHPSASPSSRPPLSNAHVIVFVDNPDSVDRIRRSTVHASQHAGPVDSTSPDQHASGIIPSPDALPVPGAPAVVLVTSAKVMQSMNQAWANKLASFLLHPASVPSDISSSHELQPESQSSSNQNLDSTNQVTNIQMPVVVASSPPRDDSELESSHEPSVSHVSVAIHLEEES